MGLLELEEKRVYVGSLVEGGFGIGLVISVVEEFGHTATTGWAYKIQPMGRIHCLVDYECNLKLIS